MLREIIVRSVGFAAASAALTLTLAQPPTQTVAERPLAEGSPVWLVEKHDCWTGNAPEGVQAGHVVVTLRGHSAPIYGGKRWVNRAIEQELFGINHNLTVHGFCR